MSLKRLNELGEQVARMQEQMREAAQEMVRDGTKAVFAEYGDIIQSFGWTQYTPFFNDGDSCEFGMHELSVIAKEDIERIPEDEREDSVYDWAWEGSPSFSRYGSQNKAKPTTGYGVNEKPNPNHDQRYEDAYNACLKIYQALGANYQTLAKDVFGDHVRVIFTPDGVDVEEYDHD